MNSKEKIQQMQTELQIIDRKLLSVIEKRVKKSLKIQDLKRRADLPIIDVIQERAITTLVQENTSLKTTEIVNVFKSIIELSKKEFNLQKK
ncbi:hypothetical protein HOC01_01675 [archaeon]|jgi:chorismate mutase|nr:hypothetical protein [archaeon]MBT6697971.1 hypothetical protein [archaeon]